ncbi:MAG TPA: hypothetical protein VFS43_28210 [Polyangiaceae bacterium]|nr:hypothetical protein [Polyangiaceae bacterium]
MWSGPATSCPKARRTRDLCDAIATLPDGRWRSVDGSADGRVERQVAEVDFARQSWQEAGVRVRVVAVRSRERDHGKRVYVWNDLDFTVQAFLTNDAFSDGDEVARRYDARAGLEPLNAPLYVGWLAAHADDEHDEDDEPPEPPLPPGLRAPSRARGALCELLDVPASLFEAAAAASAAPAKAAAPTERAFVAWLAAVPERQRKAWLKRAAWGKELGVGAEVLRSFQKETSKPAVATKSGRSVGELVAAACGIEDANEARAAAAARKKASAQERARRERREQVYAAPERAWARVDELVPTGRPEAYAQAAELLVDLRSLATEKGELERFKRRLKGVRDRYVSKVKFHQMLASEKLYAR